MAGKDTRCFNKSESKMSSGNYLIGSREYTINLMQKIYGGSQNRQESTVPVYGESSYYYGSAPSGNSSSNSGSACYNNGLKVATHCYA